MQPVLSHLEKNVQITKEFMGLFHPFMCLICMRRNYLLLTKYINAILLILHLQEVLINDFRQEGVILQVVYKYVNIRSEQAACKGTLL